VQEPLRTNPRTVAWLALVLLAALALRLSGLYLGQGYSYFQQGDGIEAYEKAVDYGRGEPRALYIGQPNYNERSKLPGPLWALFCFCGLRSGGSVRGVIWGLILLNLIFVYLTYLLTRQTAGERAALWASVWSATLPWPVYYSIGVYNPNIMAFLGTLLFLALWNSVRQERSASIAAVMVLLLAVPQFHMWGLLLMPTVIIALMLSPVRLNWLWLVLGLLAGLSLYLPYVQGEMANGWQNTYGMLSGGKSRFSWDSLKVITLPPGLLVNWVPQWVRSMADYRELGSWCVGSYGVMVALNLVSGITLLFLVAGIGLMLRSAFKGILKNPRLTFSRQPGLVFLGTVLLVPLCLSMLSGKPFHTRYCLALMGPLFALAGAAVDKWLEPLGFRAAGSKPPPSRPIIWSRLFAGCLALTICGNIYLVPAMYAHEGNRIAQGREFIPSWNKLEEVYQLLKARAGPEHGVQVNDTSYGQDRSLKEQTRGDAALIRRYVRVREKERFMASGQRLPPITFYLEKPDPLKKGDPGVVYPCQGLALRAELRD
jgi:hypothetical protein